MGIMAKEEGHWEPIPTGMFPGVCAAVWDLGMQEGYMGKICHKVVLGFEIDERQKDGDYKDKRFFLTKTYTLSLNEKANLRKDLESWRTRSFTAEELKGFDLLNLPNVNCNLNLVEKPRKSGGTWVNIASINPPIKNQEKMIPEMEEGWMPEWIKKLLGANNLPDVDAPEFDDDIPF